jgi:voltage-gated potassium channel
VAETSVAGGRETLRNPGYEVFILALSVLSLVNLVLVLPFSPLGEQQQQAIFMIDGCLIVVFLSDFAYRLFTAESKRRYFFRNGGWLDLIGSLPTLRVARIFRVMRVGRLLREYGLGTLARWLVRERAQSALYVVVFLVVLVLEVAAVLVLPLESRSPTANITTAGDALWWGIVTITTVGYGDQYPVTPGGRIVGVFVLLVGVGLFGTFTGFLANTFLSSPDSGADVGPAVAEAHASETQDGLRAELEAIRRELAAQEERSASLRGRLERIESTV